MTFVLSPSLHRDAIGAGEPSHQWFTRSPGWGLAECRAWRQKPPWRDHPAESTSSTIVIWLLPIVY